MIELARSKIERASILLENFEELNEEQFKKIIEYLKFGIKAAPDNEYKQEIYRKILALSKMKFEKCGAFFKGISHKGSILIKKEDLNELVWWVNSLLY